MQSGYERKLWDKRHAIRRHFARYDAAQISREELDQILVRDGVKITSAYKAIMRSKAGYIKFSEIMQSLALEDDEAVVKASEGRSESQDKAPQVLNHILHWKQCTPGNDPEPSPEYQHIMSAPFGRERKHSSQEIHTINDCLKAYEKGLLTVPQLRERLAGDFVIQFTSAQKKLLNRCERDSTVTLQELWMAFSTPRETRHGSFTPRDRADARRQPIPLEDNRLNVHSRHTVADPPLQRQRAGELEDFIDQNYRSKDILTWRQPVASELPAPSPRKGLVDSLAAQNIHTHHHHVDREAHTIMADPSEYRLRKSSVGRVPARSTQNFGGRADLLHWNDRPSAAATLSQLSRQVFDFSEATTRASPTKAPVRAYPRLKSPFGTDADVLKSKQPTPFLPAGGSTRGASTRSAYI